MIRNDAFDLELANTAEVDAARIVVHDVARQDPTQAFAISRLTESGVLRQAPIGIFRQVERPAYDDLVRDQIDTARAADRGAALAAVIAGNDTWENATR